MRARKVGLIGLIRAAAARARRWAGGGGGGRRLGRGTVLLMVIAVLALLAIIAVSYATLGRADRSSSANAVRQRVVEDQSHAIADYLAQVIADGTFATYTEPAYSSGGNPAPGITTELKDAAGMSISGGQYGYIRRKAFDYPSTESLMTSSDLATAPSAALLPFSLPDGATKFDPTGSYSTGWSGTISPADTRQPSTPFLASIEPSWLLKPGPAASVPLPKSPPFRDYDSWLHISNFSPSGNFVNLANLRNNFDAQPGLAPYLMNGAKAGPMSFGLTLFDPVTGVPFIPGMPSSPNYAVVKLYDGSRAADPNRPVDWDTNLAHSFRPMVDLTNAPESPQYLFNQWADADGDGFADSRWFELKDISGFFLANGSTPPATAKDLLRTDGRVRYFVAARCIDASGLVNVNTATDFGIAAGQAPATSISGQIQPDNFYAAGASPADIDLSRLLALSDFRRLYAGMLIPPGIHDGYGSIPQPASGQLGECSGYTFSGTPPVCTSVGDSAYAALRRNIVPTTQMPGANEGYSESSTASPQADDFGRSPLVSERRLQIYNDFGYDPSGVSNANIPGGTKLYFVNPFTLADEYELRVFSGINDDLTLSRLETVLGGRSRLGTAAEKTYGPLREGRPRAVEMLYRDFDLSKILLAGDSQYNQALFQYFADIRHLITTYNGARPLIDGPAQVWDTATSKFIDAPLTVRQDVTPAINALRSGVDASPAPRALAINSIFQAYSRALMPYAEQLQSWQWPPDSVSNSSGLAYGGSSELAMRLAAHMAVNLADAADVDRPLASKTAADKCVPTAMTLNVTQAAAINPPASGYPWPRLRLEKGPNNDYPRHMPGNAVVSSPPTANVNVYGIEPQPFLTEMAVYYIVTDTPSQAMVHHDDSDEEDTSSGTPQPGRCTIQFDAKMDNPDFLCEVLAFQVSNPFDQDVVLYKSGSGQGSIVYYIEFSGRSYALAHQTDAPGIEGEPVVGSTGSTTAIVLKAGQTRTFYATNPQTFSEVTARFQNASKGAPGDASGLTDMEVEQVFKNMFGKDSLQMPMILPDSFSVVGGDSSTGLGSNPMTKLDLWGTTLATPPDPKDRRVAYLWRVMRDGTTGDGTEGTNSANITGNDLLADRLRDPSDLAASPTGYLFEKRNEWATITGHQEISGSIAGPDTSDEATAQSNLGRTLVAWRAIQRPTDESKSIGDGLLPASVLEAPILNDYAIRAGGIRSLNFAQPGSSGDVPGSDSRYVGNSGSYFKRLRSLATATDIADKNFAKSARDRAGNDIGPMASLPPPRPFGNSALSYANFAVEYHAAGSVQIPSAPTGPQNPPNARGALAQASGSSADMVSVNPAMFSRSTDFLLPFCVGPENYPGSGITSSRADMLEAEWLTLGEALALATGFYSPSDPNNRYYRFAANGKYLNPATTDIPKTDRGHLVLDAWSPYYDYGSGSTRRALGPGVPFALGVPDQFSAAYGISRSNGELEVRSQAFGTQRQKVPGLLNINTAPVPNLRTLPMTAPTEDSWVADASSARAVGWTVPNNAVTPTQLFDPTKDSYDTAAAMTAYRDKSVVYPRLVQNAPFGTVGTPVSFLDTRLTTPTMPPDGRYTGTTLVNPDTRIPDIRESRGFKSIGEVLAVNLRKADLTLSDDQNSIMRFGIPSGAATPLPAVAINEPGIVGTRHLIRDQATGLWDTTKPGLFEPARAVNTYAQKLAIAAAVSNTATVRSDVFIVWFLIHGYTPEDVQVDAGEPMVPSIKKRFLMIVDRSNVVTKGDKPKIVMLKEVPVE